MIHQSQGLLEKTFVFYYIIKKICSEYLSKCACGSLNYDKNALKNIIITNNYQYLSYWFNQYNDIKFIFRTYISIDMNLI